MFDAVVVGGGAAGMMAAITAAERGKHVLLLEKNAQLGRKIRITGKGRCNVTNNCEPRTVIESTPGNGRAARRCNASRTIQPIVHAAATVRIGAR